MNISIINGPNLNLLGKREPEIYGAEDFDNFLERLRNKYTNVDIDYFQSNSEGEIIDKIHKVGFSKDGIILNAGAYTHTSIAISDAIKAINTLVVEVHISNVYNREDFRKKSYLSGVCKGTISGFGLKSYELAIDSFL
ncbi:type II 3-dehydroquinate dehydratase [Ichthyobacterium seriolicida]|uniref:3-dehydroquinate dehydratase n=1 Tax=Ichthyobacterium seriolicida TaxID=242600 RepID=A0A1J1E913_9FLAO|nr:type II 3-dehydroquinate dehydratase [Ichthyobacterium seriolicida]BAV94016.1 3-dehydroquinate dehydratase II [Ichthyobacterium seriolicida]